MADITYSCPVCKRTRKLSQYADPNGITCPDCNRQLVAVTDDPGGPGGGTVPITAMRDAQSKPALKLKRQQADVNTESADAQAASSGKGAGASAATLPTDLGSASVDDDEAPVQRAYLPSARRPVSHAWIAGLLFVVLGVLMGGFRYRGWLPPEPLAWMSAYGWIVVVAFHILIVLKALRENMLQGILALLVPGYSFYYVFAVSDDFYMRAVLAGLMVGLGQDAMYELNLRGQNIAGAVHQFIETGGGGIR